MNTGMLTDMACLGLFPCYDKQMQYIHSYCTHMSISVHSAHEHFRLTFDIYHVVAYYHSIIPTQVYDPKSENRKVKFWS